MIPDGVNSWETDVIVGILRAFSIDGVLSPYEMTVLTKALKSKHLSQPATTVLQTLC